MAKEDGSIMELKPLPVPVPPDYAVFLSVDPSHISHCNAGRRRFNISQAIMLMEAAENDPRLTGICFYHLRPELEKAKKWLCKRKRRRVK